MQVAGRPRGRRQPAHSPGRRVRLRHELPQLRLLEEAHALGDPGRPPLPRAGGAKLSSDEIWTAIKENRLKLPNTISIDRQGSVFLTPHQVSYTLNPRLQRVNFELIVSGAAGRNFLDKVQVRHDASPLTIPPRSGLLTSCSMYLKEHYVVLNQGAGNFGIHTSAVLLDPVKTFGTNIMLEIYNTGDHPVVNPMVSVEIFRAPEATDPEFNTLSRRRQRLLGAAAELYSRASTTRPPRDIRRGPAEDRHLGQGPERDDGEPLDLPQGGTAEDVKKLCAENSGACGHRTMIQALDAAPEGRRHAGRRLLPRSARAHRAPHAHRGPEAEEASSSGRPRAPTATSSRATPTRASTRSTPSTSRSTGTTSSRRTSTCTSTRRSTGSSSARRWAGSSRRRRSWPSTARRSGWKRPTPTGSPGSSSSSPPSSARTWAS